jgi:predicted dehydrogenase
MEKKNELRIGVIGAGRRAIHLAYLTHRPDRGIYITGAADPDPEACEALSGIIDPPCFLTGDYRKLLFHNLCDAVIIASPDFLHEEHAVAALKAGKAVYLEKPMATTIRGCDRILRAAMRYRQKLYLGHNMRHMPFVLTMKEIIDSGKIGRVMTAWCRHFVSYGGDAYFKDWHAERSKTTGLLLQKGTHDIDILHWLCGGVARRVTAMGKLCLYNQVKDRHSPQEKGDATWYSHNWPPLLQKALNPELDVEDVSMVLMELDNGVLVSYQQCHFTPDAWRNYTIIGSEGRIENHGDICGDVVIRIWNKRTSYNPDGDIFVPVVAEEGAHGGADTRIINEFIRYVREDCRIHTSPIAARNSIAAGYMATLSLRKGGKAMTVPAVSNRLLHFFNNELSAERPGVLDGCQ